MLVYATLKMASDVVSILLVIAQVVHNNGRQDDAGAENG